MPQTHTGVDMPCGIRRKGEASWRDMAEKPALKVKLDKRWRGLKRFTFNNMAQDASQIRESARRVLNNLSNLNLKTLQGLSYKLYRLAGVPAPRANLARVAVGIVESISGQDGDASGGGNQDRTPPTYTYLNYLNLQTINDQAFLKENFVDFQNNGTLWGMHKPYSNRLGAHRYALNKCGDDDPVDMFTCDQGCSSDDAEAGNTGDAAGGVTLDAVPAEDQLLQQLVDVSGACYASSVKLTAFLEQMATPAYIKSMATDAMLSNWDGFCGVLNGHGNNYLLYHDTAGFRIIPSGTDQTFKMLERWTVVYKISGPMQKSQHTCIQGVACFGNVECTAEYNNHIKAIKATFSAAKAVVATFIDLAQSQLDGFSRCACSGWLGGLAADRKRHCEILSAMYMGDHSDKRGDCDGTQVKANFEATVKNVDPTALSFAIKPKTSASLAEPASGDSGMWCTLGYYFVGGLCKPAKVDGMTCDSSAYEEGDAHGHAECVSGNCKGGRCCSAAALLGCATCSNAGVCSECATGYITTSSESSSCKVVPGGSCSIDLDCASGDCRGNRCCGPSTHADCAECSAISGGGCSKCTTRVTAGGAAGSGCLESSAVPNTSTTVSTTMYKSTETTFTSTAATTSIPSSSSSSKRAAATSIASGITISTSAATTSIPTSITGGSTTLNLDNVPLVISTASPTKGSQELNEANINGEPVGTPGDTSVDNNGEIGDEIGGHDAAGDVQSNLASNTTTDGSTTTKMSVPEGAVAGACVGVVILLLAGYFLLYRKFGHAKCFRGAPPQSSIISGAVVTRNTQYNPHGDGDGDGGVLTNSSASKDSVGVATRYHVEAAYITNSISI